MFGSASVLIKGGDWRSVDDERMGVAGMVGRERRRGWLQECCVLSGTEKRGLQRGTGLQKWG